jgi:GTP-binding protein
LATRYICTAALPEQLPSATLPEVAVMGRSNAGKSTLINRMVQHAIAFSSKTPGRTRALNFFNVDKKYMIVDFPGYGFAVGDEKETVGWKSLIDGYMTHREVLTGAVVVMDVRREWSREEIQLAEWLNSLGLRFILALTKVDKLNQSDLAKAKRRFSNVSAEVHWMNPDDKNAYANLERSIFKLFLHPYDEHVQSLKAAELEGAGENSSDEDGDDLDAADADGEMS